MSVSEEHDVQDDPADETGPLGYPELNLGLNNQKYALFGLFSKANATRRPIVLPDFVSFDAAHGDHKNVPFAQVYSVERMVQFASCFGLEILHQPPVESDNGWHCFIGGTSLLGAIGKKGPGGLDDFSCQFFRNLVPSITQGAVFKKLARSVFIERGISVIAQLRIEKDWLEVADHAEAANAPTKDDYRISFQEILGKIKYSIGNYAQHVYVVCDEGNLPVSKEVIRQTVAEKFGISLVWKSDILKPSEIDDLSFLDLSIMDFEMSVRAPFFVGLSLSTFSNLACFENFCRNFNQNARHYIYNCPGPGLILRRDYGTGANLDDVQNPFHLRTSLVADTKNDCLWPMALTAHFSGQGDFTTESARFPGTRRGALVCGVHGHTQTTIEAFCLNSMPYMRIELEYRARMSDGRWGDWCQNGTFAGSRGHSQPITGFAVRLMGELALSHEAVCIGSFVGEADVVQAGGDAGCCSESGRPLVAMQIVFRTVTPSWP